MANLFNKQTVVQGRLNQAQANETPNSFATINGGSNVNETSVLATPDTRMAGQEGARAIQLMNDPVEANRALPLKSTETILMSLVLKSKNLLLPPT